MEAYSQSKLANILFANELARWSQDERKTFEDGDKLASLETTPAQIYDRVTESPV